MQDFGSNGARGAPGFDKTAALDMTKTFDDTALHGAGAHAT